MSAILTFFIASLSAIPFYKLPEIIPLFRTHFHHLKAEYSPPFPTTSLLAQNMIKDNTSNEQIWKLI